MSNRALCTQRRPTASRTWRRMALTLPLFVRLDTLAEPHRGSCSRWGQGVRRLCVAPPQGQCLRCPPRGAVLALPLGRGNAKDGIPRVWVERANAEAGCVGVGDRGGAQTWGAGQLPSNRRQLSLPQVAGRERQGHGAAHGIRAGLGRLRWSSDWAGLGVGTCVSTDPPR